MVSNGKSIVIKTTSSYYNYPIKKTPLNLILNKNYILNKIKISNVTLLNDKFISYKFYQNENVDFGLEI